MTFTQIYIFSARHCSVDLTESKLNCKLNPSVLLMIPPISLDDDKIHFPYVNMYIHYYC